MVLAMVSGFTALALIVASYFINDYVSSTASPVVVNPTGEGCEWGLLEVYFTDANGTEVTERYEELESRICADEDVDGEKTEDCKKIERVLEGAEAVLGFSLFAVIVLFFAWVAYVYLHLTKRLTKSRFLMMSGSRWCFTGFLVSTSAAHVAFLTCIFGFKGLLPECVCVCVCV